MANITAALVKELRERTGAGMMECKRALQETGGDMEAAIEHMRKSGQAKAEKKAGRIAAEGLIVVRHNATNSAVAMLEVNCETDFVAKENAFREFAENVADVVLDTSPSDLDTLLTATLTNGMSVEAARKELIVKIGENINVRRFSRYASDSHVLNSYVHMGGRIGVIVELANSDQDLAKDIAMHVAASKPLCVGADQVPADLLDKERSIYTAQAQDSGKPDNIIARMVEGRIRKYLAEITLLGQAFVKDPDQTVDKLLNRSNAKVIRFERFELGEGIEKKSENFAEEVMAQARAAEKSPE